MLEVGPWRHLQGRAKRMSNGVSNGKALVKRANRRRNHMTEVRALEVKELEAEGPDPPQDKCPLGPAQQTCRPVWWESAEQTGP